ncbi:dUTP diphosphatase [Candidatus Woesearchaeota archaeon]|nr:dUTP diphosphatase [Candidatus Woesearchaeota archaeon]
MVNVKVKKIKDNAVIPQYAHEGDAGVDLYSCERYVLSPGQRVLVSTGIKIAVPMGYEAQVRPKSGLALKAGITVLNTPGTIDAPYRGEVGVILMNHSDTEFVVEPNTKVAQMVLKKVEQAEFSEVDDLDDTSRGEGGFGSTGLK